MQSGFKIIKPGFFSLVQDLGRTGLAAKGLSSSGAIDEFAFRLTQLLLQNAARKNALEVALGGLTLLATAATVVAACGADLGFHINGKLKPLFRSYRLNAGDVLGFQGSSQENSLAAGTGTGNWAYLAVPGGFTLAQHFASTSVHSQVPGIGGIHGKKLQHGDFLPFKPMSSASTKLAPMQLRQQYIPSYGASQTRLILRTVLGYQHSFFTAAEKQKFFSETYLLSSEISRMGYRLKGHAMHPSHGRHDILSEGLSFGAVQIPKDGQPIVLLKDRQTLGGYSKIGSVIPLDCFALAQCCPGQKLCFKEISVLDAQKKMREFYAALPALIEPIHPSASLSLL